MRLAFSSVYGGIALSKTAVVCCVVCVTCQFYTFMTWFIDPSLMFAALAMYLKAVVSKNGRSSSVVCSSFFVL